MESPHIWWCGYVPANAPSFWTKFHGNSQTNLTSVFCVERVKFIYSMQLQLKRAKWQRNNSKSAAEEKQSQGQEAVEGSKDIY